MSKIPCKCRTHGDGWGVKENPHPNHECGADAMFTVRLVKGDQLWIMCGGCAVEWEVAGMKRGEKGFSAQPLEANKRPDWAAKIRELGGGEKR